MASLLDVLAGAELIPVATIRPTPVAHAQGVTVLPYNACFDPQADAFLPWLWKKMQDDDLVDYYFPGQKDTGFATFVRLFSGDAQVAIFRTEGDASDKWEDRIPGFITWTPLRMGASDMIVAGFIFFRKFWDHHTTDDAAKAAFNFWFDDTSPLQVVLGVCPALHVTAMRYNKRVGLREIGRIPMAHLHKGKSCDAVLFAMTRDDWRARCQQP
jgi:RimJ/RimL family protein N-acetyltransferase